MPGAPNVRVTPQHCTAPNLCIWPVGQPDQARSAAHAGGPPAQTIPNKAESAPSAARQRRSKRAAGGAKPGGAQAPAGAKSGQHSVSGIIRGTSQDFTYECVAASPQLT